MTYADIRNEYRLRYAPARLGSQRRYALLSLPEAIVQATDTLDLNADNTSSKDLHKRYSKVTLNRCQKALIQAAKKLESSSDFDVLLSTINNIIDDADIKGVAELGRYDFAVKIGSSLGLSPKDKIYVHRTPLRVARAMHLRVHRTAEGSTYVLRSDLPDAFKRMPADSIENMFCNLSADLLSLAKALNG